MVILPIRPGHGALQTGTLPWMNHAFVAFLVAAFLVQNLAMTLGDSLIWLFYGTILGLGMFEPDPLLGPFVHKGLIHFLANLLIFLSFGKMACRRLGNWGYLALLLGGLAASEVAQRSLAEPAIGASGIAMAAVGLVLVLRPRAPLHCSYWIPFSWGLREFPVALVVGVMAFDHAVLLAFIDAHQIALAAHGGGFTFGIAVGGAIRLGTRRRAYRQRAGPLPA